MAIYTKNLEKWEKDEEYKKVCFAIVDPQKKSNTKPRLSVSKDEETYEKWKKKYFNSLHYDINILYMLEIFQ